jgi:uncharacterized protein (UPF0179 family)
MVWGVVPPLTVVGESFARAGLVFRAHGPCEVASSCPIAKVCQTHQWGQEYRITQVRGVHHDVCKVFEGGARVVEVELVDPVASFPESKLKGSLAAWDAPVCHVRGCPNWDTCFNPAMVGGRRYDVSRTHERLECPMGYALRRVTARPTA